jgi:hypothetical protein
VIGEGPDERDVAVVEAVLAAGECAHCPVCPGTADERGDDERVDAEVGDEPVGAGEVHEGRVVRVVAG